VEFSKPITQKCCFVDSLITCKSAAAWLDSGKDVREFQLSRDSLQEESQTNNVVWVERRIGLFCSPRRRKTLDLN
jgi:hypothetical protein